MYNPYAYDPYNQQNQNRNNKEDLYKNQKSNVKEDETRKMIIELMKLIINHNGDLMKTNISNDSAFSTALNIEDDRYIKCLIENSQSIEWFSSDHGKFLITKMIEKKRISVLTMTLNKCPIPLGQDNFLLDLGVMALKKDAKDVFEILMKTKVNKNLILENGETFLTNLLKENEDENVVKHLIQSRFFDLNTANKQNETVLIVACQKLNLSIVRLLLQYGSDVSFNNYGAVQLVMMAKSVNLSKEKENIVNEIINLLMNAPKNSIPNPVNNPNNSVKNSYNPLRNPYNPVHNPYNAGQEYVINTKQDLLEIIKTLVAKKGDITSVNNQGVNILSLTYNLSDKSFFQALLENEEVFYILSNECGVQLFKRLISNKDWENLKIILQKEVVNLQTNKKLLLVALEVLKHDNIDIFFMMMDKSVDRNEILTDGETLLTDLFMNNIREEVILKIIKSRIFDVHKCNNKDQAALSLACSRLMTNVIKELFEQNCEISQSSFSAVKMTVMACSNNSSKEMKNKQIEILKLFFETNQEKRTVGITEDITITSKISQQEQYSIPSKLETKKYIWIENSSPSNFLETLIVALFAKSDNLDFLIHGEEEKKKITQDSLNVLSWKIVFPLREFGFVSSHRIRDLVELFKDVDLSELEDPSIFLSHLRKNEELLNLVTSERKESESMVLTLFVELKTRLNYITSEELLSISAIQNKLMFRKAPGCLIFQTARDAKSLSSYRNIIPLKTIEISRLCDNNKKTCIKCNKSAKWQCATCMMKRSLDVSRGFFCRDHKCRHESLIKLFNDGAKSRSKVFMNLSSFICKAKSHYYTYVRQKGWVNDWFSYQVIENDNVRSCKAAYEPMVTEFLNLSEKEMQAKIMMSNADFLQKLMAESVIFVYENETFTCY